MSMPLIYVAHPYGGDAKNLHRASSWVAFLCSRFDAIFWAPWIPLCENWPDSGESRERGMRMDIECVRRSDGLILVGGFVSPGMRKELDAGIESGLFTYDATSAIWDTPAGLFGTGELNSIRDWIGWVIESASASRPLGRLE